VTTLCDRNPQSSRFVNWTYRHHVTLPGVKATAAPTLVYVVRGPEPEGHDTLFKRFRYYELTKLAHRIKGEGQGVVTSKEVPWPDEGSLEDRKWSLLYGLFERFSALEFFRGVDSTAADLALMPAFEHAAFVVSHHYINALRWDKVCRKLASFYIRFWSALPSSQVAPGFVILLSIVYPDRASWRAQTLGGAFREIWCCYHINRAVRNLCARVPDPATRCLVLDLDVLKSVTPLNVKTWLRDHGYYRFDKERQSASDSIFRLPGGRVASERSMSEVEPHLERIRLQFAERKMR